MKRLYLAVLLLPFAGAMFAAPGLAADAPPRGREARADPADALDPGGALNEAERQALRALFARIASPDFDRREEARKGIAARGPRALAVAREFAQNEDLEIREFARGLYDQILQYYDGYLPTAPALESLLEERCRVFIGRQESFAEAFRRFSRSTGLRVIFDGRKQPEMVIGTGQTVEVQTTVGEGLRALCNAAHLAVAVRGDSVLVTTPEKAAVLAVQQHEFPLLEALAADAARLAAVLQGWLPPGAECAAEKNTLRVRGSERDLRLAARALHLLRDGAPSACFPESGANAAQAAKCYEILARNVPAFKLDGEEPVRAIARLRGAGLTAVELDPENAAALPVQPPISLDLERVPLGFCLEWLRERCASAPENVRLRMACAYDPDDERIRVSFVPAAAAFVPPETVCGADIAFLFENADGETSAAAARKLAAAITDDLSLVPCARADYDCAVFQRRVILRGPPLFAARALSLIERLRAGTLRPPAWRIAVDTVLDAEIEWDGAAISPVALIPKLRGALKLNILLRRAEDGKIAQLNVDAKDAFLLPAGRHKARALLDRLCAVSAATWSVDRGAVVLDAKPPEK